MNADGKGQLGSFLGWITTAAWFGLATAQSGFWRVGPGLPRRQPKGRWLVVAVIPARDEEQHLGECLEALLRQRFQGDLQVLVVNDNSTDGTATVVQAMARTERCLHLLEGQALPYGWTGKMWAVAQGLAHPLARQADFVLLTDADILHGADHVASLVHAAEQEGMDLVSEMVRLRTESWAERATVPAFVFFFGMLYPFSRVSDPQSKLAAAAGGTMLLRRAALDRIDDVSRIGGELIDDVALAREVKRGGHRIWLGHANDALSLRRYPQLKDVWNMVARTAYVQLRNSPAMLLATMTGMVLLYIAPVALTLGGRGQARRLGAVSWLTMAGLFQPVLRRYHRSPLWGLALPAIAAFYMAATVGSAVRHYRGLAGQWKGRSYPQTGRIATA